MGIIQSQTVMLSLRLCDKKKPVRSFERTGFFFLRARRFVLTAHP